MISSLIDSQFRCEYLPMPVSLWQEISCLCVTAWLGGRCQGPPSKNRGTRLFQPHPCGLENVPEVLSYLVAVLFPMFRLLVETSRTQAVWAYLSRAQIGEWFRIAFTGSWSMSMVLPRVTPVFFIHWSAIVSTCMRWRVLALLGFKFEFLFRCLVYHRNFRLSL